MTLGIMQPYFFPYIGYWQLISAVDKYVIYDDVNYIKGGWINRNRILLNGKEHYFNVYLNGASPNKLINEVEIGDKVLNGKNLKTLEQAYKKAPFYKQVYPILEETIQSGIGNLARYNGYIIKKICEYLEVNTELIYSSEIEKDNSLKGKEKVISICKTLNADKYINAIGGKMLYNPKEFAENGVLLAFLKTDDIMYNQFSGEFVKNLSIIDVLMFNSPETVKDYLNMYSLEVNAS